MVHIAYNSRNADRQFQLRPAPRLHPLLNINIPLRCLRLRVHGAGHAAGPHRGTLPRPPRVLLKNQVNCTQFFTAAAGTDALSLRGGAVRAQGL